MNRFEAILALLAADSGAYGGFEEDTFETQQGNLTFTFLGHGTLMLAWAGKVIHVDPVARVADYSALPKADLILITHHHRDHMDPETIRILRRENTSVVLTELCAKEVAGGIVMKNGESKRVEGVEIEALPACNVVHMRSGDLPFHLKGEGNGYILTLGGTRVYIAGDTEETPEMRKLEGIDIAFLPMNLPYTMTPEMAASAARAFSPRVLYPYHYGDTDPEKLTELMKDTSVEVRVRSMR
jgi:L-ascorbate metabolism protein UlaG (beta-lactamase superfamily)